VYLVKERLLLFPSVELA